MGLPLVLFAQTEPLAVGGAGWLGAGLLGTVLAWLLLVHLPAKDRQLKELIDAKDRQLKEMLDSKDTQAQTQHARLDAKDKLVGVILDKKWAALREMSEDYKASLREVTDHCAKELAILAESLRHDVSQLTQAIQDLSTHVQEKRE